MAPRKRTARRAATPQRPARATSPVVKRLLEGNRRFVASDAAGAAGLTPRQHPFAAVLGCSDARVPTEMVFEQACNDLFVVRVAGNVLSSEGLGSLDYAARQFQDSLRALVVLGHSGCGAVTAAVDAFLAPLDYLAFASSQPLRAILDRLFIAIRGAARSLRLAYGEAVEAHPAYRQALIEVAVVANAALTAHTLAQESSGGRWAALEIVYGVYDLASHEVWAPGRPDCGLVAPPKDRSEFVELGRAMARAGRIRRLLRLAPLGGD